MQDEGKEHGEPGTGEADTSRQRPRRAPRPAEHVKEDESAAEGVSEKKAPSEESKPSSVKKEERPAKPRSAVQRLRRNPWR